MPRYFNGLYTTTQTLSNPATDNPATVTGTITVPTAYSVGLYGSAGYAWTITNLGTVESVGTLGVGIELASGGFVTNGAGTASTALIQGSQTGVEIIGATGTVINSGTIAGTYGNGIYLAVGGIITNNGLISGTNDVIFVNTAAGTIGNTGTIAAANGTGIWLNAAGAVTNSGLITGANDVIFAYNGNGAIYNDGTISNTGSYGTGTCLDSGGSVINGLTGFIDAPDTGVMIAGSSGTVVNLGTVVSHNGAGVGLSAGGSVTNGASGATAASIGGVSNGVVIAGTTGSVANYGTIASSGPSANGVYLADGGSVVNAAGGLIVGSRSGVAINIAAGTVDNFGTIAASITYTAGIYLGAGGSVTNQSSGFVEGGGDGVDIAGSAGTVTNLGAIAGLGERGVWLGAGGTVANGTGGLGSATITGGQNGIDILGTAGGSVINGHLGNAAASIGGAFYGVFVRDGIGTVTNYGAIFGGSAAGIFLHAGGAATNAAGALIAGSNKGIQVAYAVGTVDNSGVILGGTDAAAVYLGTGGSVSNRQGGVVEGGAGADIRGAGAVVNLGTITGVGTSGFGVSLSQGGPVTNGSNAVTDALISGPRAGVQIYTSAGTVTNFATITASITYTTAVYLHAGGSLDNRSSGFIQGAGDGIIITSGAGTVKNSGVITGSGGVGVELAVAGSTLTNAGTIGGASGSAVNFTGANNRLIIDPGAVFVGSVYGGGGGNDVLELAAGTVGATGTLDGSPGRYSGFDYFTVDPSAKWLLTGLATLAPGTTLSNAGTVEIATGLTVGGSLVNTGVVAIGAGATLALANGASGTGSIDFAGSGGTIEIDGTTMPAATITISGFTPGETIDLRGVSGGNAGSATLSPGNLLTVFEGGSSFALQLDPVQGFGGFAVVDDGSGGTDVLSLAPVVVSGGQTLVVSAGQTLIGAYVQSGGTLEVASGGNVFGTQISSGGREIVDSGGSDDGTLVYGGGSQTVEFGGVAQDTVLYGAAVQTVFGSAGGTTVSSGDSQIVEAGGVASATTVANGGSEIVLSGGLTIDTVIAGGLLELSPGALASGSIDFSSTGGVLQIDSNTMPTTPITGFTLGDAIDLRALPVNAGNSVSFNDATSLLTVSGGGTTNTLTLSGIPLGTRFGLADDGTGNTLVQEIVPVTSLFDFVFTYNDGKDYYYGTVADDGTLGYTVGQQITSLPGISLAGSYSIFAQEGLQPAIPRAVGSVQIVHYSHGGPGVASPTPLGFSSPGTAGTNGLGSESDMVLGTDGQLHSFGPTTTPPSGELSFSTADLYGFVFSYTDGAAFYSGTVAVTSGTTPAIPAGAGLLGFYSVFAEGVTTRPVQTVIVDRLTVGGLSFPLNNNGAFDGTGGLGSEAVSITTAGTTFSFSDQLEPALALGVLTVPSASPSGTGEVIIAGPGDATLTATQGIPTLFDFTSFGFGNDTIVGFDPSRDTIELPHALVANITTLLQQETTATAGGALITLNASQSIALSGIAPTSLGQTNFLLA